MNTDNGMWYEWMWVGMGVLWGGMTLWGSITAWRDWRWVCTHPDADPQVQAELRDRTATDLRYETSSLLGACLITYLGMRAVLLPPSPFAPELWGQIAAGGALVYSAVKTMVAVQNRLTRRRFDLRLDRKEHAHDPSR